MLDSLIRFPNYSLPLIFLNLSFFLCLMGGFSQHCTLTILLRLFYVFISLFLLFLESHIYIAFCSVPEIRNDKLPINMKETEFMGVEKNFKLLP